MGREFDRRRLLAAAGAAVVTGLWPSGYIVDEIGRLSRQLAALVARHETTPAATQLAAARWLRNRAASLGRSGGPAAGRIIARTWEIQAQVHGWTKGPHAFPYARKALEMARRYNDAEAAALATGHMSVLARYAGLPQSVMMAQKARRLVPAGHPLWLLLLTTEARARAEQPHPDSLTMRVLLDEALDGVYELDADRQMEAPGLSFDKIAPADVLYATSIAWLRACHPVRAFEHIDIARETIDGLDLPGYSAMLRVEQAIYHLRAGQMQLDHSCQLVDELLARHGGYSALISTRLGQWTAMARQHAMVPEVHRTIGRVATWRAARPHVRR